MSDSMQPHGQQPTRLLHPQDSPGKNTGVGCHFLLWNRAGTQAKEISQKCRSVSFLRCQENNMSIVSHNFMRSVWFLPPLYRFENWCLSSMINPLPRVALAGSDRDAVWSSITITLNPASLYSSVHMIYSCCCSFAKSCLTLCNPVDCSISGFPVLHGLPEFAQTQGHWVGDAIQPTHSLSCLSSPPTLYLPQHQGLLQ